MNDEVIQQEYTWDEFCQALDKILDGAKVPYTQIEDNMEDWIKTIQKAGVSSESFKSI